MSRTSTTFEHAIGAEGLFVLQLGSGDVRLHGVDGETVRIEDRHGSALPDGFDIEAGEGSLAVRASSSRPVRDGIPRRTWTCACPGRRPSWSRPRVATSRPRT